MEIRNNRRSGTLCWHSTAFTGRRRRRGSVENNTLAAKVEVSLITEEWCWPWIPWADSLQSKARCQIVTKAQDMSREMALISCLKLMPSTIAGESKQHVQGRVTRSESELMI